MGKPSVNRGKITSTNSTHPTSKIAKQNPLQRNARDTEPLSRSDLVLGPIVEIHIGTFDNPHVFVPTSHAFYNERLPWVDKPEQLPRYEGFPGDSPILQHGPTKEGSLKA